MAGLKTCIIYIFLEHFKNAKWYLFHKMYRSISKKFFWFPGQLQGYLLGDSAYGLRPFLLTPFLHPNGQAEENYNRALCKARPEIEKVYGNLKHRFAIIHFGFRTKDIPKAQRMLSACVVLHNICNNMGDHDFLLDDMLPHVVAPVVHQQPAAPANDGRRIRDLIVATHFV